MLISTLSYNAIPFTTVFSQFFTFLLLHSHLLHEIVCIIKSFLCHDIKKAMSYHIMEFMSRHVVCHDYRGIPTTHLLIHAIRDITVVVKKVAQNPAVLASYYR